MEFAYKFIEILSKSVEKNGNKELTTLHLLNIVKMCVDLVESDQETHDKRLEQIINEIYTH
jgi:hypothetical protein